MATKKRSTKPIDRRRVDPQVRRRGKVRFWVLVGHWHGSPCAIRRGQQTHPFAVWSVTDERQWRELRREGFYTRRSCDRPVAFVDRTFQNETSADVFE